MGDSESAQPPSKKRGALKQLSDEVLASRRIVRIKRKEPSAAPPTATTNPFAGIQLLPATTTTTTTAPASATVAESKLAPAEAVVEDDQKTNDTEEDGEEVESKKIDDVKDSAEEETKDENQCVKTSDDQTTHDDVDKTVQGTDQTVDLPDKESGGDQTDGKEKEESSAPKFSFGDGSGSPFGFGLPSSNSPSLFGAKKSEGSGFPPKQEVSVETGEENEEAAFSADSIMFEYLDGGWRERGKGEVKVNVSSNGGKARLVMRAKGNYRLILNASLYPEMKLASMDKKGITFACVNSEGRDGLSTFALKFKDPTIVEEFRVAVDKHKGSKPIETAALLKTPENSPTATDA
ncbi:hypothetical protein Bca52824_080887 [Brassica carinata]|uniref:RanBD1 domain-containing protein n=1 Tax=Brassica carinata TaxID=52824 RepID=A0A8X7PF67_BRACI|nr:hypothetical protein Bca52824_080887 [Brassica carinata]